LTVFRNPVEKIVVIKIGEEYSVLYMKTNIHFRSYEVWKFNSGNYLFTTDTK